MQPGYCFIISTLTDLKSKAYCDSPSSISPDLVPWNKANGKPCSVTMSTYYKLQIVLYQIILIKNTIL